MPGIRLVGSSLLFFLLVFMSAEASGSSPGNTQGKYRHYDASRFIGHGRGHATKERIRDVMLGKIKWGKEKRISLIVKTDRGTYRDDFIFCTEKRGFYYCSVEDDGGYVRLDEGMNMQLNVDFATEGEEEPLLAYHIEQRDKNEWLKPLETKTPPKGKCFNIDIGEDRKLVAGLSRKYSDIPPEAMAEMEFARFYYPDGGLSLVIPANWTVNTKEGRSILFVQRGNGAAADEFILKDFSDLLTPEEIATPEKTMRKTAGFVRQVSEGWASKVGDRIEEVGSYREFYRGKNIIGHFVLRSSGRRNRWESYTLIWSGGRLYLLIVMGKDDELSLVEFLASLGMESFCSGMPKGR